MDSAPFKFLIRFLAGAPSRRGLLASITSGIFAAGLFALGPDDVDARKNGKRKGKRKRKKNKRQDPALPPLSPPSPGPATRVDALCPGPAQDAKEGSITDGNVRVAQTFTALASGPLERAELLIDKAFGTSADYILHVGAVDNFGVPTNEVLAATSVANLTVPDGESMVPFVFANPVSVSAGTRYALVLTRPGSTSVLWVGHFGDSCPGRTFLSANQTAPFDSINTGFDLIFTTFVRS